MPSKTLLFNKELILQILRSTGWISIVYFLGLTFALPLEMLMMYTDDQAVQYPAPVRTLFEYGFDIQVSLLMAIPILLSVFMFRYLHVKQAADLMHCIPVKREKIFHHHAISGMIALILPVVLVGIIVSILHGTLSLNRYFGSEDIVYWGISTILLNILLFAAGIFVAMMTGISAVQGVLTYIFLMFPAGIVLILFYNLKVLLFGFPSDYYLNINLEKLSPLTYAVLLNERILKNWELLLFAGLTLILYFLALYFYKRRKIESVSEAIAIPRLRSIFKYGVTFCTMLFGGMYFSEFQNNSIEWISFGYIIGSVIGYLVAEMVLQKTWRVLGSVKGLLIYAGVVALLVTAVETLGIYENRVPAQEEVKSVVLAETPHILPKQKNYGYNFTPAPLMEADNIQAVTKLHEQIVADKKIDQFVSSEDPVSTAFFLYELKNGDKVIRQYSINEKLYDDLYKPIYETEEYKRASNEIFKLKPDQVNHLTITSNGPGNKFVTFNHPQDIKGIFEVIQADILEESYADSQYFQDRGSIEIHIQKDHYIYMSFKPSYLNLNKWLKDKGLLEKATMMPEDVSYIQVGKWNKEDLHQMDPEQIAEEFDKRPDVLKVSDKKQIDEILNKAGWGYKHEFVAVIHYERGSYPEVLQFDEEHTPEFIKNHFK